MVDATYAAFVDTMSDGFEALSFPLAGPSFRDSCDEAESGCRFERLIVGLRHPISTLVMKAL